MEVEKFGKLKGIGKHKKKTQIVLVHTSRNHKDYLLSLIYRFNGKNPKLPHYLINREGKIYQILSNSEYSKYFSEENINKQSIIISLENLGWLEKEPLTKQYVNWIGDIYNGVVYEKKWRDYFFWQPYTEEQINSTVELTKKIFEENSIKKSVIGHNTKINGIEKFEGIVTRSNYFTETTDLNPSFDFEYFLKKIEDE